MKKIAVFGNTGGGKSALARRLAELTRLPLYPLDIIQFRPGGGHVPHAEILAREAWIIDGYGCTASSWERFAAADTLVYVDLPLARHFLWVSKRFFQGLIRTPEGWPEGSPMIRSTLTGYRVLWLCEKHLAPRYRALVADAATRASKRVHHLRSLAEVEAFVRQVRQETQQEGTG